MVVISVAAVVAGISVVVVVEVVVVVVIVGVVVVVGRKKLPVTAAATPVLVLSLTVASEG